MLFSPSPLRQVELAALKPLWPWGFGRPRQGLTASIKSIGLLRPLTVAADGPAFKIVSGHARRAALLELGQSSAPALVLPEDRGLAGFLEAALAENFERGWDQAELALIWKFLADHLPEAEALRLSAYLGLDKSPKIRAWAASAAALPEAALKALAEDRLDLESAARLSAWEAGSRAALLDVFETLAPSKQKKRLWLDWLEDLSRREKLSPADILQSKEIKEALTVTDGRKAAAEEAARRRLWLRRHPLLAELSERRNEQIKSLALPDNLKLEADPTFEDLKFSLNLTFADHEELKALARKVSQLAESPAMLALLKEDGQ